MYKRNSNPPTFNSEMARLDSRSAILHNFSTWPSSVSYCQFFLIAQPRFPARRIAHTFLYVTPSQARILSSRGGHNARPSTVAFYWLIGN